jgi:hypothetical protein
MAARLQRSPSPATGQFRGSLADLSLFQALVTVSLLVLAVPLVLAALVVAGALAPGA